MQYTIFQVDAFTDTVFTGNPAAVVPLEKWLPDWVMQNIALENNLSETAFFVPSENGYLIRWFTPLTEVNLCGHATLATAHVLFKHLDYPNETIIFQTKSDLLKVNKEGELITLDFPASALKKMEAPEFIEKAFGIIPQKCFKGREDMLFVFKREDNIHNLRPDFNYLKTLDARGIIATAPSQEFDFVSRYFAPAEGIDEDPVTGSAHTLLIPFWAGETGKKRMIAKQISTREGILHCQYLGERVKIAGKAVTYLKGIISL